MKILPSRAEGDIGPIIETYKSTVYAIALTRTGNRHDAEDIFQEVFLAYCRKQPSFNGEEHRKAWLIKTTVNCSKKLLSRGRSGTVPLEEASGVPYEFQFEEDTSLYAALCGLPEKYRTAMHLFYFEDLSAEEIGKTLNIRPGTVRMRLTRGRELLREKLKGEYYNE